MFRTLSLLAAAVGDNTPRVMIAGGLGQVGTDLALSLRQKFGPHNVLVTDSHPLSASHPLAQAMAHEGDNGSNGVHKPFVQMDCLKADEYRAVVAAFQPTWLYHLPAVMSVRGEREPHLAMEVNITSFRTALDIARDGDIRIMVPSSIAVFGADCGKTRTPDDTILNPTTIYGVTKILTEQLGTYYNRRFGTDFRCPRLPGILSAATLPGGGTTDYAVHMYHQALRNAAYTCPLRPNEALPMMYMDDTLDVFHDLMAADRDKLTRCVYNVMGCSFTPAQLRASIERRTGRPLDVNYVEGVEQQIAHSWPDDLDVTNAVRDWQFAPKYDLDALTDRMLELIAVFHSLPPPPKHAAAEGGKDARRKHSFATA